MYSKKLSANFLEDILWKIILPLTIKTNYYTVMPTKYIKNKEYFIGEQCVFEIEAPNDGHIVVFHHDTNKKVKIIFPQKTYDNSFIAKEKKLEIHHTIQEPEGKHFFKAFWTSQQLIKPENIDFNNEDKITSIIEYLKSVLKLDAKECLELIFEFEVRRKR
ncbi:MAG: DUF4384 domain-containing protein [Desulfobacterales bacterium]|nr:DUF4384 domain-containing protein [Desulfobacterales bacterium]